MNQIYTSSRITYLCIVCIGIICLGCVDKKPTEKLSKQAANSVSNPVEDATKQNASIDQKPTEDKAKHDVNFSFFVPNLSGRDLPIVAIFFEPGMPSVIYLEKPKQEPERRPIILMAWSDGMVLYSSDFMHGGAPYRAGTIDRAALNTFFDRVHSAISWDQTLGCDFRGPDASTISIVLRDHDQTLYLNSWHELHEKGGGWVATTSGIEQLDGRKLSDVIKEHPAGYQQFRVLWETIRNESKALIPKESQNITPVIESRLVGIQAKPLDEDWGN